jgi:hypothetical protein
MTYPPALSRPRPEDRHQAAAGYYRHPYRVTEAGTVRFTWPLTAGII